MREKRGQGSFEYISIVAVALLLIIPSTVLFLNYSQSTGDEVLNSQFNFIGNTLLSKSEEMFVLGRDSWSSVEVNLPNSFQNATIVNSEDLVFTYQSRRGESQAVFFAQRYNLSNDSDATSCSDKCTLDLQRGTNRVLVRSQGDFVSVERR